MKHSRDDIKKLYLRLQTAINHVKNETHRKAVSDAMMMLDDFAMNMRRKEIFAAGAAAERAMAEFEGRGLGSIEAMTFYDGYASTHPDFKNPYRSVK